MDDNDFDVIEPGSDGFSFGKDGEFSHQLCVFKSFSRAQDCLSQEMKEGFSETKQDNAGNIMTVIHPDSRRQAIEAILTLKNVMIADIDKTDFKKEIDELIKLGEDIYDKQIKKQKTFYDAYPLHNKNQ